MTVRVRATDNVEVKEVELFSGDTSLGRLTSGVNGEYTFRVDTTRLADGPHTLRAVAKDRSGNTGESKVAVVVDNKVPVVRWIFPVDGQRVEGVVTLHVEVQDEDAQPQVEYEVNGQGVVDADTNRPGVQWDTRVLKDGEYELRAIAKDRAGNRGESVLRVKVDNEPPQIEWVAPSEEAALKGRETLVVHVEDFPGVEEVSFLAEVGGQTRFLGAAQDKGGGRWELVWDTGTFPNGQVTLHAVARSPGDRQSVSSRRVNVANPDTEPPVVRWIFPVDGQRVEGVV
ncbi:MAG: Ig-like domain-containing protein, partial [Thermaceae bacterium]